MTTETRTNGSDGLAPVPSSDPASWHAVLMQALAFLVEVTQHHRSVEPRGNDCQQPAGKDWWVGDLPAHAPCCSESSASPSAMLRIIA